MKIAVSGKGGVGKTILASFLTKIFAESGYSVLAIDADPDTNLAATLGFPNSDKITPISEMDALIEERTGAPPGRATTYFRLNPKVDDLPVEYHNRHYIRIDARLRSRSARCQGMGKLVYFAACRERTPSGISTTKSGSG